MFQDHSVGQGTFEILEKLENPKPKPEGDS